MAADAEELVGLEPDNEDCAWSPTVFWMARTSTGSGSAGGAPERAAVQQQPQAPRYELSSRSDFNTAPERARLRELLEECPTAAPSILDAVQRLHDEVEHARQVRCAH